MEVEKIKSKLQEKEALISSLQAQLTQAQAEQAAQVCSLPLHVIKLTIHQSHGLLYDKDFFRCPVDIGPYFLSISFLPSCLSFPPFFSKYGNFIRLSLVFVIFG